MDMPPVTVARFSRHRHESKTPCLRQTSDGNRWDAWSAASWMTLRVSRSVSYPLRTLPPLPPGSPDIPEVTEDSNVELPLMEPKSISKPSAKLTWLADTADLFILWCSFLFTAASIVLVALVFHAQVTASPYFPFTPSKPLLFLQRTIAALSLAITSAVIMVAGKRYVLFKLARGGLRSQRVAVYSNPTISNLASYMTLRGVELPLLGLSAVWGLALATGLTVNDSWEMGPFSTLDAITVPFGPLDQPTVNSESWIIPAIEQLNFVMSSWCLELADTTGLVNITGANAATDPNQTAIIYYPPLPSTNTNRQIADYSFSTTAMMNGVNISLEPLSAVPSTAQNLSTCVQSSFTTGELWFDGSDDQTLSIVVVDKPDYNSTFRVNATAIIMGGVLTSFGKYSEFALNGTSWPNVMSTGNRWGEDVVGIICNTTMPPFTGACPIGSSLSDFAALVNQEVQSDGDGHYGHWSTVLNMAVGAYSSAMFSTGNLSGLVAPNGPTTAVSAMMLGVLFTSTYGTYILLANIIVSLAMLVIVMRLRLASGLGPDFINSTRLLLNPLETPELFNASLQTTVNALSDPYMLVAEDAFLLVEGKSARKQRDWFERFTLRGRKRPDESCDDTTDHLAYTGLI